jgi:hypothetical protein
MGRDSAAWDGVRVLAAKRKLWACGDWKWFCRSEPIQVQKAEQIMGHDQGWRSQFLVE